MVFKFFHQNLVVLVSLVILLLILPFYPIITFIIKYQSPRPLFFSQERIGLNGKTFQMYKFRSMHVNGESNTVQVMFNDPFKFPFGKIIQNSCIDELPQLYNVLIGDMCLIRLRPYMLAHTDYSTRILYYIEAH